MSVLLDSVLLGDIGATNARFSLLSNGNLSAISSFGVAEFGQFTDALAIFIKEHCRQTQIHKALLAVAGPVKGERVALTNSSWVIDTSELQTVFGLRVRIVNDFEAVALSLPSLTSADLAGIGGGKSEPRAPMAVLGPGTGLGVACLVDRSDRRVVMQAKEGMQHWHRLASKRIASSNTCANGLAMFRQSGSFLAAAWKTSIRPLPRLKDWNSRHEMPLKLPRTPLVASAGLPDDRCRRFALFWDPLREMLR